MFAAAMATFIYVANFHILILALTFAVNGARRTRARPVHWVVDGIIVGPRQTAWLRVPYAWGPGSPRSFL